MPSPNGMVTESAFFTPSLLRTQTDAFGCQALHQYTHHGVGTRVPASGNDAHLASLLAVLHLLRAVVQYACMNVERVYCVNAFCYNALCIFRTAACRCGKNGYINVLQFCNVVYNLVWSERQWFVFIALTSYDTCNFKVSGGFECLKCVVPDVPVAYYCCSDFLHNLLP